MMTVKEYLNQYRWAKEEIQSMRDEIAQLEALAEYVSPKSERSGKVGCHSDRVGTLAAKIADERDRLGQRMAELLEVRDKIKSQIDEIDNMRYRLVLTERYINCKQWEKISADAHYSLRAVQYIHRDAIEAFGRRFPMAGERLEAEL